MLFRWLAVAPAAVAGAALTTGCWQAEGQEAASTGTRRSEVQVQRPEHGFRTFLASLTSPKPRQEYFSVAVPGPVVGCGQSAVWVDGLKCDGKTIEGKVVKNGHVVRFSTDEVCDWMIVEDGRVTGAYTLRGASLSDVR